MVRQMTAREVVLFIEALGKTMGAKLFQALSFHGMLGAAITSVDPPDELLFQSLMQLELQFVEN